MGDHGGLEIAKMLCENKAVRAAELGNMDLGHRTLTMLGEALKRNKTLTSLNIDRPLLFSAQVVVLLLLLYYSRPRVE